MADYIDKLSYDQAIQNDEDDYLLSNEEHERLLKLLFDYEEFVIMQMNFKVTGIFAPKDIRRCVMFVFQKSEGVADIRQAAYVVANTFEEIDERHEELLKILQPLFDKYDTK